MVELRNSELVFSFPDIHPSASMRVQLQRTLRIPDDGKTWPLPPGLGPFPIAHVDDHAPNAPRDWLARGGVMVPMYQSEALWLQFSGTHDARRGVTYPFAVKIAAGRINAVDGEPWADGLSPRAQDYVVVPEQPWLDGFSVEKGTIRQFVAMPLGSGYSAEEQLTGAAEFGGLQIQVYPMRKDVYERRFSVLPPPPPRAARAEAMPCAPGAAMGLAPGGRMKQTIERDPYGSADWDTSARGRCFVHLCNALTWRGITGTNPPPTPISAKEYTRAGLPWFAWYGDDEAALAGSARLGGLRSVSEMAKVKGDAPPHDGECDAPEKITELRAGLRPGQVREGRW